MVGRSETSAGRTATSDVVPLSAFRYTIAIMHPPGVKRTQYSDVLTRPGRVVAGRLCPAAGRGTASRGSRMSTGHLHRMFRPHSVAVIGANNRPQRVGNVIMRNLLAGGFDGPIMPVNPRHQSVAGVLTYPDVASL